MSLSYNSWFFKIYCNFFAKKIGEDTYGNKYFQKKKTSQKNNFRQRRFVIYNGNVEASKIPQEWNAWLHHITDDIPNKEAEKPSWIKEHTPNLTGTPFAYEYKDSKDSSKIKNVYSIWKPKKK
jgi:NADH:ubiquinone oxidoreductase subunit